MSMDFREVKRILSVHHQLAMGDAVLLSVAFDVLKRTCPRSSLSVLTRQYAVPFLEAIPGVDEIIPLERFGIPFQKSPSRFGARLHGAVAALRLALFLRSGGYDCIVLRNDKRIPHTRALYVAASLSGARHIISLEPFLRRHVLASRHIVRSYLAVLEDLGHPITGQERPRLTASKEGQDFADSFLRSHGLSRVRHTIIGLCPVSNLKVKNWSPENVAKLGNSLMTNESVKLLLFCVDERFTREVVSSLDRPPCAIGYLPFSHLLGIIAHCDLFIGVDTGPTHVAAALEVPTVGIYGPTSSTIAGPCGEKTVALQAAKDCPYYLPLALFHPGERPQTCYVEDRCQIVGKIGAHTCTDLVSPEEVFRAAKDLLREAL